MADRLYLLQNHWLGLNVSLVCAGGSEDGAVVAVAVEFPLPAWCRTQMLTISARLGFEQRKSVLSLGSPMLIWR